MADRLAGRYPDLVSKLPEQDIEALRAVAQNVVEECYARLSPEARDILADEGFTPDHSPESHDPDLLDAAYLDALKADKGSGAIDLFTASRMSAAVRYAAEATTASDLHEAIFEALIAANTTPDKVPSLARLLNG
ncbi:hypothetical protein [Ostreiculturibacter nitratireducens]|uniref:hypothetical protein n=1 Tax=Ostreiculturibacter nitratireducens TaxID=3075226 RepID=UPI0031B570FC